MAAARMTSRLRALLRRKAFIELPAVYDPLAARLAEAAGFNAVYNGGFVTGAHTAISEPLLTMTEQIGAAEKVARAVSVPVVMRQQGSTRIVNQDGISPGQGRGRDRPRAILAPRTPNWQRAAA